jgi:hypothetical protein
MREDMTNKYRARPIIDFDDKTIRVSFNVKDGQLSDRIGMSVSFAHIGKALPLRFLGNAVPRLKRSLQVGMSCSGLLQSFSANHMHALNLPPFSLKFRILRTFCQGENMKRLGATVSDPTQRG